MYTLPSYGLYVCKSHNCLECTILSLHIKILYYIQLNLINSFQMFINYRAGGGTSRRHIIYIIMSRPGTAHRSDDISLSSLHVAVLSKLSLEVFSSVHNQLWIAS